MVAVTLGAALLFAGARVVYADQAEQGAPADTATSIGFRFSPVYLNQISGDVSYVAMKNSFQTSMTAPFGSIFHFTVSGEEKHYRLQDKLDESKQLNASVLHVFNLFSTGSIGFADSRIFNRSIIPGGAFQDYVLNDKSINANGSYKRQYPTNSLVLSNVSIDANAAGSAVQSERTYKDDETLAVGGFGGVAANVFSRDVRVNARLGHRETWDRSTTSIAQFDSLGSGEDSLSTGVSAVLGDSIFLDAKYVYYSGQRTWADQAQGSLGGQQSGVQYVFRETEERDAEGVVIALNAKVWDRFHIKLTGNHDNQLSDYAIQTTRYSNTVGDALRGSIEYVLPWKTLAMISAEDGKTLRDFGPQSVSSYNDIRKKAALSLSHRFRSGFMVNLDGTTQLTRTEYLDPDANPRDRDQIDTSVNLKINSKLHKKLAATVSLAYSATEFINIDASQSENNRTRDLYELRPGFTYNFSDRFVITQTYGISIEYTDYVYKPTSNFLDRNLIFSNRFDFKPARRITFIFDYAFNFHDNGSYLPDEVTGEDVLSVEGEDRRDRINLRLDYRVMTRVKQVSPTEQLTRTLAVFAEQRYSRFEDRSLTSGTESETEDGQITVGTRGDYDFGTGRKLKFTLARVKRFSKFGSEAEKNYWDMRSEFNYPF